MHERRARGANGKGRGEQPKLMVVNGFDVVMNREGEKILIGMDDEMNEDERTNISDLPEMSLCRRRASLSDLLLFSLNSLQFLLSFALFVSLILFCSLLIVHSSLLDAIWRNSTMAPLFPLFSDFNRALLGVIDSFQLSLNSFHFSFSILCTQEGDFSNPPSTKSNPIILFPVLM